MDVHDDVAGQEPVLVPVVEGVRLLLVLGKVRNPSGEDVVVRGPHVRLESVLPPAPRGLATLRVFERECLELTLVLALVHPNLVDVGLERFRGVERVLVVRGNHNHSVRVAVRGHVFALAPEFDVRELAKGGRALDRTRAVTVGIHHHLSEEHRDGRQAAVRARRPDVRTVQGDRLRVPLGKALARVGGRRLLADHGCRDAVVEALSDRRHAR
mmetsp:Transcript_17737/g.42859  ORF Transcript_17737/g.42859 Transcript_17737/m.42859 type:complete len:213 (+) Transcript_17737:990-1628(+)